MMTFARYTLAIVLASMLLLGCAHPRPTGARLTTSEAVRIAKEAAERDGIRLSRYKRPEARYYRADKTWFVFFDGRGVFRTVGSFFAVIVDDQTGVARISYGM